MGLTVSTAATFDVVSIHDVKAFASLFDDDNDGLIKDNIRTAVEALEDETWRTFAQKGYTWTFDRWPDGGVVKVPRGPLISVASIKYYDTAGNQQTITSSEYRVATSTMPGRIDNADGYVWPTTDGRPDGIEIIFTAGHASAAAIPSQIKTLVKAAAAELFYCRDRHISGAVTANPAIERMVRNVRFNDFHGFYP